MRGSPLHRSLLVLWLSSLVQVQAQDNQRICAWYRARYGTVRDTFYIDGGTILEHQWQDGRWLASNPTQRYPSGLLHGFNFSNSFDGQEPADLEALLTKKELTGGGLYDAPDFSEGAIFTSDLELYTYGGTPRSDESASTILNYRLYPADGQTIFTPGPKTGIDVEDATNYVTSGGYASSEPENKAWYFSGMRAKGLGPLAASAILDDPRAITNHSEFLITADMSLPGEIAFVNTTLPQRIRPRINPELVWVGVGTNGALLAIGGVEHHQKYNFNSLEDWQIEESEEWSPTYMKQIPILDIGSGRWYLQETFGEAPMMRAEFCAVVASPNIAGTYDIYIYGGDNGLPGSKAVYADDTVWVLSVPSFTWTRVSPGTPAHGRSGHGCALPFPDQMLVFGGQNLDSANLCIQDGSVVDVFDLNSLSWTRKYSYDSFEQYTRPRQVIDAIEKGGAILKEVEALFARTYEKWSPNWYPYGAPGEGESTGSDEAAALAASAQSTNVGTIVGGVVGGVAAAVLGFVAFWFCWPSRRAARRARRDRSSTYYSAATTAHPGAVARWLRRTTFSDPPPKQSAITEGSVTDSHEEPVVPPNRAKPPTGIVPAAAEVHGDSKFRSEMSSAGDVMSPRSSDIFSGATARTRHMSEADGQQIHEMFDESAMSPRRSVLSPLPSRVPDVADVPPSYRAHELDYLNISGPGSNHGDSSDSGPDADHARASLKSPPLDHHQPSISNELSALPPTRYGPSDSSGPISPMSEPPDVIASPGAMISPTAAAAGRPPFQRHGSSMISSLSVETRTALEGAGNADKIEQDRKHAERTLEGNLGPIAASPAVTTDDEMKEKPAMKRAFSSRSKFTEDVTRTGEKGRP